MRHILREPLLHFVLIGLGIFAADQVVASLRGDSGEIVITQAVRREARDTFFATSRREPTPAELKALLDRWRDNEVLYREGIALGLDKGDSAIRERVISKALGVAQSGIALPAIDEAALRRWYEARRGRYDTPARFDFEEAVLTGDAGTQTLQAFAAALNGHGAPGSDSSLRVFRGRPRDNLVLSYGEPFTAALERLAPGTWSVLPSRDGDRLVRVAHVTAAVPSSFAAIRDRVQQDWRDEQGAIATHQAIDAMARKYRVRVEQGT